MFNGARPPIGFRPLSLSEAQSLREAARRRRDYRRAFRKKFPDTVFPINDVTDEAALRFLAGDPQVETG